MQLVIRDLSKTYPNGTQALTDVSPKLREGGEPSRAGIDPYHKLIDRQGNDNVVEVEAAGADRVGAGR